MKRCAALLTVMLACTTGLSAGLEAPTARVKITQAHLVALCLNRQALSPAVREWTSEPRVQQIGFTMRNEPRPGITSGPSGIAVVSFLPEAGHRYEIEVRAEPGSFSTRIWRRGQWTPVVRDRTTDRIVSTEPDWQDTACGR